MRRAWLVGLLFLVACSSASDPDKIPRSVGTATGAAADALRALPVHGRAPHTGYSRDRYGPAWTDVDSNGCDTRNDVLNRDLTARTWRNGTRQCVVLSGDLADPYTGHPIAFSKANAADVQIDHVVALSDAWATGSQGWPATERLHYANDPLNLLAVDGQANQDKGDGDAATWLPPNKAFRCQYVSRQIAVKTKYRLWVTAAERNAMGTVLAKCPGQPLPAGVSLTQASATPTQQPTTTPTTTPTASVYALLTPSASPRAVFYPDCAAARAAGHSPLNRGDPGYRTGLDGDGDGVACEPQHQPEKNPLAKPTQSR
jgi:hypothetical protein